MAENFPLIFGLLCGGIFVLALIGLGAFLVYRSVRSRKQAEASQTWPSVVGEITESMVKRHTHTDDDGHISYSYSPTVRYTYNVSGEDLSGKNIAFGFSQGYNTPNKAEAVTANYPVGKKLPVYYNPVNPADAVLERKAGSFGLSLTLGIVFLVIGLCLACGGLVAGISNLR